MKYLVQADDDVFFYQAVVEAPARTDKMTLLEIAWTRYGLRAYWVRPDYFEDGRFRQDVQGWAYEDEVDSILAGYEFSPGLGLYIDMDNVWTRPVPPNTELGYFVRDMKFSRYRQKSEWL